MFDMGLQPMSLVSLQDDPDKSAALETYPIQLAICRNCTHVHNIKFDPSNVKYTGAGCRMYNNGTLWQNHIDEVQRKLPLDVDFIIEIGAGDCEFLAGLDTEAELLAVDPCEAVEIAANLDIPFARELFDPDKHFPEDDGKEVLIVMRHLLEHMEEPRDLLDGIVRKARQRAAVTHLYIEVPNCGNALDNQRIEDWTYEHPQHFTIQSMHTLMKNAGAHTNICRLSYGNEVVCCKSALYPSLLTTVRDIDEVVGNYAQVAFNITAASEWIHQLNGPVAFWGGAGKSAMFIRQFDLPSNTIVVDSHYDKWQSFVPGTRIPIRPPTVLKKRPVEIIIATTSWRANDIRDEIIQRNIPCKKLLKFECGKLTEVPLGNQEETEATE
jgi:hypothetical protein